MPSILGRSPWFLSYKDVEQANKVSYKALRQLQSNRDGCVTDFRPAVWKDHSLEETVRACLAISATQFHVPPSTKQQHREALPFQKAVCLSIWHSQQYREKLLSNPAFGLFRVQLQNILSQYTASPGLSYQFLDGSVAPVTDISQLKSCMVDHCLPDSPFSHFVNGGKNDSSSIASFIRLVKTFPMIYQDRDPKQGIISVEAQGEINRFISVSGLRMYSLKCP